MSYHIRWMTTTDWPDVLAIDDARNPDPWTEGRLKEQLRKRNMIGMVARHPDLYLCGFMIYELMPTWISLIKFVVHPAHDREGIGSAMMGKLVEKLTPNRRTQIRLRVRETNLAAQLFFQEMKFSAVSIEREHFADTQEDAYLMVRGITQDVALLSR